MKILVACEESQVVTKAFRELGHLAFSCDIQDCSGGHPEWHLKQDVLPLLTDEWDMLIAFPPCTTICVSGNRWYANTPERTKGAEFFMHFINAPINKICVENPVGVMSTIYKKPTQYIQPWQFGHPETKKTGLWLKNLPKLTPTNIVEGRNNRIHFMPPSKDRSKLRSKTYQGIAKAMAEQWG